MSRRTSSLKTKSGRLHLRLRPAAEAQVRSGHPWIFAESIREQNREGKNGELAVIFDKQDRFLALGLYDPASPIRVRVIHQGQPADIDEDWWRARLRQAAARRAGIFDGQTSGGRWINGESDGFPGLVLDRYADTLVLKLYSAVWFPRIEEISGLIREEFAPERVILRLSRNTVSSARELALADGQILSGPSPSGPVIFLESGLRFEADVLRGQKTGFFLDQRENRRLAGSLARAKNVLNTFSYSGGFSLYAADGGARSVTDVDLSAHALESARRNFALNPALLRQCEHRAVQADVFEWIQHGAGRAYDLVILDPPSLAKRQSDRAAALNTYLTLAQRGFALTRPGGITLCCSCSGHIRADEFFGAVIQAAQRTRRNFRILHQTREPDDHHAAFAEAAYLKAAYVQWSESTSPARKRTARRSSSALARRAPQP